MADLQGAALGDDLALLSLKVAVQVDRKLRGIQIDQSAFVDFGNELSKTTAAVEASPNAVSYLQFNPAATEVLAKALRETSNQLVSNTTELANALSEILEQIRKLNDAEPTEGELSRMKLFCLSLHKSMMSQKLPPPFEADHAFEDRLGILR